MTDTSRIVAYLARSETVARRVARALEAEGIACTLAPASGYARLEDGRVEVRVSGEAAPQARVLAIAAAGGTTGGEDAEAGREVPGLPVSSRPP